MENNDDATMDDIMNQTASDWTNFLTDASHTSIIDSIFELTSSAPSASGGTNSPSRGASSSSFGGRGGRGRGVSNNSDGGRSTGTPPERGQPNYEQIHQTRHRVREETRQEYSDRRRRERDERGDQWAHERSSGAQRTLRFN